MKSNYQLSLVGSLGALVVLGSWTVWAQTAAPTKAIVAKNAAPEALPAARNGDVNIRNSPQGKVFSDIANSITRITKDVRITQDGEDFILYADEATHYENEGVATARNKLLVESRDSDITGDLIRADFNAKIITVTGNVVMKSHGKDDGIKTGSGRSVRNEVLHKASSLTCDRLDYDYENHQAKLSGNLRMRQDDKFGTCEQIIFDEDKNIAQLIGKVNFSNGGKGTFRANSLTIWIDENRIATDGRVGITLKRQAEPKTAATPRPRVPFAPPPELPADIQNDPARKAIPTPTPPRETPIDEDAPPRPTDAADKTAPEKSDVTVQEKETVNDKATAKKTANE